MSLQYAYDTFRNNLGLIARDEASDCPCRGYGWISSPFDTQHKCPRHFAGQRHPESDEYALPEVVLVSKVENGEQVPVYQLLLTIGHCGYDDAEATFMHFYEFDTEDKAKAFGDKVALRADISSRVTNNEYWMLIPEVPTRDEE